MLYDLWGLVHSAQNKAQKNFVFYLIMTISLENIENLPKLKYSSMWASSFPDSVKNYLWNSTDSTMFFLCTIIHNIQLCSHSSLHYFSYW